MTTIERSAQLYREAVEGLRRIEKMASAGKPVDQIQDAASMTLSRLANLKEKAA